ncbi:Hypothetical protein NTJ_02809 [Nesidiocoris tenuis]|uniref:Uncharacterized protein n=1 Tax=Nesidiocoris tenuis TaxID=355587 RepID=A0ABN7AGL0_9HEMI|nr:Hypothetical protein NTJ_02809 [Nesidiocoris tenuis]
MYSQLVQDCLLASQGTNVSGLYLSHRTSGHQQKHDMESMGNPSSTPDRPTVRPLVLPGRGSKKENRNRPRD